MILYDKVGKPHKFNIFEEDFFDYGTQAKIYRINYNDCLKVIYKYSSSSFNEEMFDILQSLSLSSLVKLGTPFYRNGKIKAYTMEYLERSIKSILDMPTQYLLENLHNLYKDILILAKNSIITNDLYYRNLIVGDSKITLIDLDGYIKMPFNDDILKQNIDCLLYTFKRLFQEELILKGFELNKGSFSGMSINKYLDYLFGYNNYKEEPAMVLERKIIGTRTPLIIGTRTPLELFNRKW